MVVSTPVGVSCLDPYSEVALLIMRLGFPQLVCTSAQLICSHQVGGLQLVAQASHLARRIPHFLTTRQLEHIL